MVSPTAKQIREQLKRSAIRERDLGKEIANDWFAVDRESWQTADEHRARVGSEYLAQE
jgi:hypothetical protein